MKQTTKSKGTPTRASKRKARTRHARRELILKRRGGARGKLMRRHKQREGFFRSTGRSQKQIEADIARSIGAM